MATLTKPMFVLFPIGLSLIHLSKSRFRRPALGSAALFLLVFAGTLTPWLVRNASTLGAFPILATNGGEPFWFGHNPEAQGFIPVPPSRPQIDEIGRILANGNEIDINQRFFDAGLNYARENPLRTLGVGFRKLLYLWNIETGDVRMLRHPQRFPDIGSGWRRSARWALGPPFVLLTIAFIFACFFVKPADHAHVLILFILYSSAVAFVFLGATRYHLPFVPHMIICTAGAARLRKDCFRQKGRVLLFSATLAAYLLAMAYFNFEMRAYREF